MPFIPHTPDEQREMLATIGVDSIEALFEDIPKKFRAPELNLPAG
jgi:glycine dehydrogenase subunit 1